MRLHQLWKLLAARFRRRFDCGSASTEYAILAAFLAAVIFVTVADLAGTLDGIFLTVDGMIAP